MGISLFFKPIAIGIPIAITCFDYFGYVARVEGISMQPTLNPGGDDIDYVFLSKWAVNNFTVSRGDVISLISPKDPKIKIIKRIVGLEGDVVKSVGYKNEYVKVPSGHMWIEGDNLKKSLDSNLFGPVPLGLITAQATFVIWPPKRWQNLNHSS